MGRRAHPDPAAGSPGRGEPTIAAARTATTFVVLRGGARASAVTASLVAVGACMAGVVAAAGAHADDGAERVRRFRPKTVVTGSNPLVVASTSRTLYFHTTTDGGDGALPTGFWRVSGRDGTPQVARDFGAWGVTATAAAAVGDSLFFAVGRRLWRADGGAPVRPFTDLASAPPDISLRPVGTAGGVVVFSYGDTATGAEPWRSDGTPEGTRLLLDIAPGDLASNPSGGVTVGSVLYFSARDEAHGAEVWRTDGTAEGTRIAADLLPGPASSGAIVLGSRAGVVFASGTAADGVRTIWALGVAPDSARVLHRAPGGSHHAGASLDGAFVFTTSRAAQGTAIWRTDGTTAGTAEIAKLLGASGRFLGVAGGRAFFTASDAAHGTELWTTDGTAKGTSMVADLRPGSAGSDPGYAAAIRGALVFAATTPGAGREMWRSDGTAAGTYLLADIAAGGTGSIDDDWMPNEYYVGTVGATADAAWFAANGPGGVELWVTDGTTAGTRRAGDLAADFASPGVADIASGGGTLFLAAEDADVGRELWTSDGSDAGTAPLTELAPGEGSSWVRDLEPLGDGIVFVAGDAASGSTDLWTSDGATAGRVRSVPSHPSLGGPAGLSRVGDLVWFRGGTTAAAWRTDGTADGTFEVGGEQPFAFAALADATCYFVRREFNWWDLWRSDGTVVGTGIAEDVTPPVGQTTVGPPVEFEGRLFFPSNAGDEGLELWSSDGTADGTALDTDVVPGAVESQPAGLTVAAGRLFFSATTDVGRRELFARDADGTVTRVWDLRPAKDANGPSEPAAVGDVLFFAAPVGPRDVELWKSDGTASGTVLVRDIDCGPAGSSPRDFLDVGDGRAVFVATDAAHGTELWTSDGTAEGTALVADVVPGPAPSNPRHLTLHDGHVWFAASADGWSTELWRVPVASLAGLTTSGDCDDSLAPFDVPPPQGPEPAALPPEPWTPPDDPKPKPPPAPPAALDLHRLEIRLRSRSADRDTLVVGGRLPLPSDADLEGVPVRIDVGGVRSDFVLDRRGRAAEGRRVRFEVRRERRRRGAPEPADVGFVLSARRGAFAGALADEGLPLAPDEPHAVRQVLVTVVWRGVTYEAAADLAVSRRRGVTRAHRASGGTHEHASSASSPPDAK